VFLMAHEMGELDSAMYGSNEAAWHGLGTVVTGQPSAADAIRLACLEWQVGKTDLYILDDNGNPIVVNDNSAIIRLDLPADDVRRVLGVCGSRYEPVQNAECFGIADALVGQGGARFETAGSLRNGKIVYMTAVLPDAMKVQDDILSKYLLITSSHDGSGALVCLYTPVRVVCHNTLTLALKGKGNRVSIRHTKSATDRMEEAKRILQGAESAFSDYGMQLLAWAQKRVSEQFATAYLKCLFPSDKTRGSNIRQSIYDLFSGKQRGADQDAVRGTAYGLLNSVVEWADHNRSVRKTDGRLDSECRFESSLLGTGADLKARAGVLLTEALENEEVLVAAN
jgi:phage/plasmid-like protein (TIGR03299 family)